MTRELEKLLKKACKETGKRRGWKTISGRQYQVRDGVLYILSVGFPVFDGARTLKAHLRCKPLALDEMYWDVFHMAEEAKGQPFSFHVQGAFTAPSLWLPMWKETLPSPEMLEDTVEAVFHQAEALAEENAFPDIAAYRERLEAEPRVQPLGIVLCLLCEGKYARAMEVMEKMASQGDNGGFSRENGRRSILEDARDWCAGRMEGEAP